MTLSPDGNWIALVNRRERQQDIFMMRSDGSALTRLTDDLGRDWAGRFTPDSTALTFYSNKEGAYDGWSMRLDDSNRTRLTSIPGEEVNFSMFAPDGRRLMAALNSGSVLIGRAPWPFARGTAIEIASADLAVGGGRLIPSFWSRDGRWLAGAIQLPSGAIAGNALYDVAARTVRQCRARSLPAGQAGLPPSTRRRRCGKADEPARAFHPMSGMDRTRRAGPTRCPGKRSGLLDGDGDEPGYADDG